MSRLPVISLVGRPNVGKSTLFNRLTRTRDAIVADVPGLTRDRQYGRAQIGGRGFIVIDTGGFEPVAKAGIAVQMARQARQAVIESDCVVFVCDARTGLSAHDREIASELRRTAARLVLVVNKAEGMPVDQTAAEFHELGLDTPIPISAAHGDGIRELFEHVLDGLSPSFAGLRLESQEDDGRRRSARKTRAMAESARAAEAEAEAAAPIIELRAVVSAAADASTARPDDVSAARAGDAIAASPLESGATSDDAESGSSVRRLKVAVVGRPNVGKSTLINTLLGEERLVAFDQPGTTRDAVAIDFERGGKPYTLIDTAGLRRRGKVTDVVEKFSMIKTLQAIEDCNVCILMLDASEEIADQDATIAGHVLEAGRAVVVAINKWEICQPHERDRIRLDFERKMHFLKFAQCHFISAREGNGLAALMRSVDAAYASAMVKMPTPKLTRMLREAVDRQSPPRRGLGRPKLRYAHQGGQNPPIVVIHGSGLDHVPDAYKRYLESWFRDQFKLTGTPMRVEFRTAANPYVKD